MASLALSSLLIALVALGGCSPTDAPRTDDRAGGQDAEAANDASGADAAVAVADAGGAPDDDASPYPADTPGDSQTPPTGASSTVAEWLRGGAYRSWHCEPTPSAGATVSPHGAHRVCSNDKLSAHAGGGEYPVGAANVSEIHDADGGAVVGYAVALHLRVGSTGDTWYWYEDRDGSGATSNGAGVAYCVNCHSRAGSYSGPAGHDFVFTRVP